MHFLRENQKTFIIVCFQKHFCNKHASSFLLYVDDRCIQLETQLKWEWYVQLAVGYESSLQKQWRKLIKTKDRYNAWSETSYDLLSGSCTYYSPLYRLWIWIVCIHINCLQRSFTNGKGSKSLVYLTVLKAMSSQD